MNEQNLQDIRAIVLGQYEAGPSLKPLLIAMRTNHAQAFANAQPISAFARNACDKALIASGEVTFLLQFLSQAIGHTPASEDARNLLLWVQDMDFTRLTPNGSAALYYLLNNLICYFKRLKLAQFCDFQAITLNPRTLLFLSENDASGLQHSIFQTVFRSDRFALEFDASLAPADALQQFMVRDEKLSLNALDFAVRAVCNLLRLDVARLRLPELQIPVASKECGVFATDEDISVFEAQREYILQLIKEASDFISLDSEDQLSFVLTALQLIQQQTALLDNAFDKKVALESGAGAVCLFLILLGLKTQPREAGRFSYCGFGYQRNAQAQQLRVSLLYALQNLIYQNPIGLEWLGQMDFFDAILVHQLGDGATVGCAEIVSLIISSCRMCKSCVDAIQRFVSEPADVHEQHASSQ